MLYPFLELFPVFTFMGVGVVGIKRTVFRASIVRLVILLAKNSAEVSRAASGGTSEGSEEYDVLIVGGKQDQQRSARRRPKLRMRRRRSRRNLQRASRWRRVARQ